jgi:hypothetical protein
MTNLRTLSLLCAVCALALAVSSTEAVFKPASAARRLAEDGPKRVQGAPELLAWGTKGESGEEGKGVVGRASAARVV